MGEIDDVETQLRQEFGHLAGTITVPAAPGVAGVSVRPHRRWVLPATVAAAVLLLLVGVTVAIGHRHGPTQPTDGVPKSIPTVPFVLRQILYVDGSPMPGRWYEVVSAGDSWVAGKRGSGWWWGAGRHAHRIAVLKNYMPQLSADGSVLAVPQRTSTGDRIRVFATGTGKVLGTWHVDLGRWDSEKALLLGAVTAAPDVKVILHGILTNEVWNLASGEVRPLTRGLTVFEGTPAGLVFADRSLHYHLGTVDASGAVHLGAPVPARYDALSRDGWYLRGLGQREVRSGGAASTKPTENLDTVTRIVAARLGSRRRVTLDLPAGWGALGVSWEAPGRIIGVAVPVGKGVVHTGQQRLYRCLVAVERCGLIGS